MTTFKRQPNDSTLSYQHVEDALFNRPINHSNTCKKRIFLCSPPLDLKLKRICQPPPPPPPNPSVGPNFSHHKARVQAVGWFPLGTRKLGSRLFAAPPPPPPPNRNGAGPKADPPPPPACPRALTAGRHRVNEVPPLAEKGRTLNDEYVGIWDPHGNPAGGPPLPNK